MLVEAAQFAQPESVAEASAALGDVLGGDFAVRVDELLLGKIGLGPVVGVGVFVIAEDGDALLFEL